MSNKLTIVAKIEAKKDKVDFIKNELLKLIQTTREEEGCLQYDLNQDKTDPSVFLFYENWESREQWRAHMENDHLKQFKAASAGALESFSLNEMSLIE
jgi:quinol monooxygenase YgiN